MIRFDLYDENISLQLRIAVILLPIIFLFLSFVPTLYVSNFFATILGIDNNIPFIEQDNSIIMLFLGLFIMTLFGISGFIFGWFLNGIILRVVFKWPKEKIFRLLLSSEVPPEWLEKK